MQIVSNIALISINETLVIQLISFLILLFIMNRIMFRPLREVMSEREEYVQKMASEISDAEGELQNVTDQLKREAAAIKQEAFEMKEELEDSGSRQAAEIFETTRKEIATLKERNMREIEVQMAEARKHTQTESETIAVNIMEKILNRRLVQ